MDKTISDINGLLLSTCGTINSNNTLYFWAMNVNGLFAIGLLDGRCECLFQDDEKGNDSFLRYASCLKSGEWIIFAPYRSSRILMFNLRTKEYNQRSIGDQGEFSYLVEWNEWVYFWGGSRIIRMSKDRSIFEEIHSFSEKEYVGNICHVGNYVYVSSKEDNEILEYNLNDLSVASVHVEVEKASFCAMCYADGLFWIGCNDKRIIKWRKSNDKAETIALPHKQSIIDKGRYHECYSAAKEIGDYIYFSPLRSSALIRVNKKSSSAEIAFEISDNEITDGFFEIDNNRTGIVIRDYESYYNCTRNLELGINGDITEKDILLFNNTKSYSPGIYENEIDSLKQLIVSLG